MAAVANRGMDVDPALIDELLAGLPFAQVLSLLDPSIEQLCPVQVRLLDALAALDAGPGGRLYRWLWPHCFWPFDWRLPGTASTRALAPAWIRMGIEQATGQARDPEALARLPGVKLRHLPGLGHVAITIAPGDLPGFGDPGLFIEQSGGRR